LKILEKNIKPVVGGKSLDMAIEALEKQIPKKVVDMIHRPNGFYGKCQVCGCSNARMQFCQRCGHKLDWSEQNERT
jgi:hypothetical protein